MDSLSVGQCQVLPSKHQEELSYVLSSLNLSINLLSDIGELTTEALLEISGAESYDDLKILDLSETNISCLNLTPKIDRFVFQSLEQKYVGRARLVQRI